MSWGAMAAPVAGAIMGMFGRDTANRQQVAQQAELNKVNSDTAKDMGKFNYEQAMKMWKETNVGAQAAEMKKAGMSVGNMYGGSGAGGAISASAMSAPSGGNADGAAATQGATTQMGMMGAQMALLGAQKANVEANTEKTKAETVKTGVDTDVSTETWRNQNRGNEAADMSGGAGREAENLSAVNQMLKTQNEKQYNDYEAYKAAGFKGGLNNDPNSPVAKAIAAGLEKTITDAQNAKTDGNIKAATAVIEGFKANLAKQGIAPDTPWGIKLISDIASKLGFNPLDWIKK